ncbi:hypothetical protein BEE12_16200 [Pantoea agglomerans]|uniref:hypothetical protein n=1 Tax=Enterobacter agglomerans TaxID=549 RepID=UPI00083D73BE|nr:hypothetical protein [Pantoea agglomerans]AOE41258.1 hypothetical protein BEE12_16200 [Pantoea agglomerans]
MSKQTQIEVLLSQIQTLEFKNAELKKHVAGQQRAKDRFATRLTEAEEKLVEETAKRHALERRLVDMGLFSPTGQLCVTVRPVSTKELTITPKRPRIPITDCAPKWGGAGECAPDHGFLEFAKTDGQ